MRSIVMALGIGVFVAIIMGCAERTPGTLLGRAPSEAVAAASDTTIVRNCASQRGATNLDGLMLLGAEVRDLRAVCSKRVPLSPADKANGTTEKWCITMRCLVRLSKWHDFEYSVLVNRTEQEWRCDGEACACE
jgi:hypothetical protein